MSLPHAVLTSLLEKSTSGYDLARRFDKSIGYFWHATHQQIYRELARMEGAELVRWAAEPTPPMDLRDSFTVKLRADAILDEVDLCEELARHNALHAARLAQYRAIEARDFPATPPLTRAQAIQHMILKKGILYEEGEMAWGQEMLALLRRPAQT
jgi:hypothetical protein